MAYRREETPRAEADGLYEMSAGCVDQGNQCGRGLVDGLMGGTACLSYSTPSWSRTTRERMSGHQLQAENASKYGRGCGVHCCGCVEASVDCS
mmetsp:Transcript_41859/g.104506  ORF Transcript_41859/g.104506 Transcript_41859/m.104506 type:complete len:93 (-) Transcript_41859:444-722(-)